MKRSHWTTLSRSHPPSTDPALELGAGGRTLLQERLGIYGLLISVLNMAFFGGVLGTWSGEPTVGGERAWALVLSPPSLLLALCYGALALVPRLRPLSPRALRALDLVCHIVLGVTFMGITEIFPVPSFGVYEALLALTGVLAFRALLVPSSALFTLSIGVVACVPSALAVLRNLEHFAAPLVAPRTMRMIFLGRSMLALAFSSLASAVLYRLRREMREARRLGQYTLEERLGQGGMGVVYRARHAMLRRPTAIKLLVGAKGESLERFEREAQLTAQLTHPNAIVIHDYGRTADGTFYYAMEYLDGIDLEQLVELDGPQPAGRVVHLLRQACGALAEAHAAGLIHRDVKPANLFLCRRPHDPDFVKVLDFGLVKHLTQAEDALTTGAHTFLGTPLYMAPEAFTAPASVDARSDVYALGAVAYRLLAGVPVFEGKSAIEICAKHVHEPPVPLSERMDTLPPPELEAIVMRCLAKERAQRFASAEGLATALEACPNIDPWSARDAHAWWETHAERIAHARSERGTRGVSPGLESIFVEPRDRPVESGATQLAPAPVMRRQA